MRQWEKTRRKSGQQKAARDNGALIGPTANCGFVLPVVRTCRHRPACAPNLPAPVCARSCRIPVPVSFAITIYPLPSMLSALLAHIYYYYYYSLFSNLSIAACAYCIAKPKDFFWKRTQITFGNFYSKHTLGRKKNTQKISATRRITQYVAKLNDTRHAKSQHNSTQQS